MEIFNEDAVWQPDAALPPISAKDKLSEIIGSVILGLELLQLLAKRIWLKWALKIVIVALESFVKQFCTPKK